jgi:hypothetical protein
MKTLHVMDSGAYFARAFSYLQMKLTTGAKIISILRV